MTALREPPEQWEQFADQQYRYQSYHVKLTHNQERFIRQNSEFFRKMRDIYAIHLEDYLGKVQECVEHYNDPHQKRPLRVRGYENLLGTATLFCRQWVQRVTYKMKRAEWAKIGKYARMIGDLGVEASLAGFRVTEYLKKAESENILSCDGVEMQFIKSPSQTVLREAFTRLLAPPDRGYFCYFSDDSCFSIRVGDKVYTFNLDISGCDASHTKHIFGALLDTVPACAALDMADLIQQLECPIKITSVSDPRNKITLKADGPKLYSGSTVTTRINNLANQIIARSLSLADFSKCCNYIDVQNVVIKAAEEAGYIVTCDYCPDYSSIQFLKHSPVYDTNGNLQPMLNLGVLLRLSGMCNWDLPGRGDLHERARLFQRALLRGVYPRVEFKLLTMMRRTTDGPSAGVEHQRRISLGVKDLVEHKVIDSDEDESFEVEMAEIYRRYHEPHKGAPFHEWYGLELEDFLGNAGYGVAVSCQGASMILEKDYGLVCH